MRKKMAAAGLLLACGLAIGAAANTETSKAAAKYTISKSTKPCNSSYSSLKSYNNKTKNYYTIKSYLERLGSKGGGTLVLKKGTYKVCSTLEVPSNVTIKMKNGVKIKKTYETGSSALKPTKTLFKVSSPKAKNYKGTKKVVITSAKSATIDLGNVANAIGIDLGHNYNVSVSKIRFKGKKGGAYINIAGSRRVSVENCTFMNGANKSGDKYKTAITINSIGSVPCENIKITSNTFSGLENGIASTKYKKSVYSTKVSVKKNTFTNMSSSAVLGKMWASPTITSNTVKRSDAAANTAAAVKLYSVTEPEVSKNDISNARYAVSISRSASVNNVISAAKTESMKNNTVKNLTHYYVPCKNETTTRLLYFQTKEDNNFTITPSSEPYREHYTDNAAYTANSSQAKTYFIFRSYMEQLEYAGGGTINITAGTYTLSHSVCIPSNVTVNFADGVRIQKVKATNTNLATNKTMFEIVPPSKEGVKNSVSGYGGSQNVILQGSGNSVIDCNNVVNSMAVVMGHANNVTIRNIAFTNEYGSHFIELNSSQNVTVENCSFTDFRIYNNKSHKEAINIDTTDANNNGFNYEWSTHDRTACNTVNINNCIFTNMGVAVGSHTYSVNTANQQIYHENVTIQNCKINQTYNAGVRILNWRNAIIRDNSFVGIQGINDKKDLNYNCILVRGAVNPTITKNEFGRGSVTNIVESVVAVRIDMQFSTSIEAAVSAGYADTICQLSEQNIVDLRDNKIVEGCKKYFKIKYADGEESTTMKSEEQRSAEKPWLRADCKFNDSNAGDESDETGKEDSGETVAD
ncbi:MAG: right-handed parallel beta-helix repeat-containing protein [Roseburia sp.]|nr:right-handed parallel beta-helix repeat-containing protein [Roseburia sp.]